MSRPGGGAERPKVLLIGFSAEAVDPRDRRVDLPTLRTLLADGDRAVAAAGYELSRIWIGPDHDAAVAALVRALTEDRFDTILIGDGVRARPRHTELFERLVNVVHRGAPGSGFAFNAEPGDTVEALRRHGRQPVAPETST